MNGAGSGRGGPAHDAVDALAVLAITVLATAAFQSSYGGVRYLVLAGCAAALAVALAVVLDRRGVPLPATVAIATVVYAVVGGALALPHRTIAGFVPTPDSALAAVTATVTGWRQLITTAPPVGATGDLLAVPVFSAMAAAFAGAVLAQRHRRGPLPLVPAAAVLGLAIATGTERPVSVLAHGAGLALLGTAWLSWRAQQGSDVLRVGAVRPGRLIGAMAVLAVAGGAALAIGDRGPFQPGEQRRIWRQVVTPPFDPRQYPSPLSTYRQYVKAAKGGAVPDPVLFTVAGLPEGIPVRLATMDAYDGLVWQVSAGDPDAPSLDDSGSFERVGVSLRPEFPGEEAEVTVTIGAYNDVWVPDVGEVIELRFTGSEGGPARDRRLAEQFRYNRATDTAASRVPLQRGDRYVLRVRLPVLRDALAGAEIVPNVARIGVAAPVDALSASFGGPELLAINDTGRRLDTLRDELVRYGAYSDGDLESGHQRARAGHSVQRLDQFVAGYPDRPLVGNAEQYAASFALTARQIDRIPTRVVMGFRPSAASLDAPVDVKASEVDAWVEVPVAEEGWVAIFPTPPRDHISTSSTKPQQPEPDYRTQNPPPPPLIDPEFDRPATATGKAKSARPEDEQAAAADGATTATFAVPTVAFVAAGAALSPLVSVGAALIGARALKARRRRRRRRQGAGHELVANGWREVVDFAVDTGRTVPVAITRREAAQLIGGGTTALAARADQAVWAPEEPDGGEVDAYWRDTIAALEALRGELSRRDRLKADLSMQSFRRSRAAGAMTRRSSDG